MKSDTHQWAGQCTLHGAQPLPRGSCPGEIQQDRLLHLPARLCPGNCRLVPVIHLFCNENRALLSRSGSDKQAVVKQWPSPGFLLPNTARGMLWKCNAQALVSTRAGRALLCACILEPRSLPTWSQVLCSVTLPFSCPKSWLPFPSPAPKRPFPLGISPGVWHAAETSCHSLCPVCLPGLSQVGPLLFLTSSDHQFAVTDPGEGLCASCSTALLVGRLVWLAAAFNPSFLELLFGCPEERNTSAVPPFGLGILAKEVRDLGQ